MSVVKNAEKVLEAADELRELQRRMAELDAERATVEKRIQVLLKEIRQAAGAEPEARPASAPADTTSPQLTSEKILSTLRRNPGQSFTAVDLMTAWNDGTPIEAWHTALSRLAARGMIRRKRQGFYSAT
jgi:DNA-binding transcriptional MocR family regulator